MKLFTFSGISSSLSGVNLGLGLIELANNVVAAMPAANRPTYSGIDGQDHFHSDVDLGTMLGVIKDAVQLNGVSVLNAEAQQFSPAFAAAMVQEMADDSAEDVLILAHSQGTNNLIWTLLYLAHNEPDFFQGRSVRCALFDPKVGRNFVEQIFGIFPKAELDFLFFQSENDILGDQGMLIPKFITEFQHGDHIWVRGLDHGSIREWASLNKQQRWLNLPEFLDYSRAWSQEVILLRQEQRGGQLGTEQLLELDKWTAKYARDDMNYDRLSDALLGFLQGKLPAKFKS